MATAFLPETARSLREGFFMFWETLWALVLGFTLSGIVQAFISKDQMRRQLGDHRPGTVAKASFFGMVSSSCSYAASAMSKSLFAKGADFISSMAFMVASTNLVVELGIVLLVLMGWQFMAAEFVGGPIMIALLALLGGMVFTPALLSAARKRLNRSDAHDHGAMAGVDAVRQEELEAEPLASKLRSPAAWSDAANYAVADVTMLRKELVIGYVVAGFLSMMVPTDLWSAVFLQGHGFWTSVENALVGPLIAVVSWVCSIGNVPLAAALWTGGISFGGVIAFVFADLIAMPLILIYVKFYGARLALRLVGLFYVVMVLGGLVTELIFGAAGLIPKARPIEVAPAHFSWNYTTFLNIAFLVLAAAVWWLARNKERFGGGRGYAIDPVCGMQVRTADSPASTIHEGAEYHFCADRCLQRFVEDPERFVGPDAKPVGHAEPMGSTTSVVDPVCGMDVELTTAAARVVHGGVEYGFCAERCKERFVEDPDGFLSQGPSGMDEGPVSISLGRRPATAPVRVVDPVCGMDVELTTAAARVVHDGVEHGFCSTGCAERFAADPNAYLRG